MKKLFVALIALVTLSGQFARGEEYSLGELIRLGRMKMELIEAAEGERLKYEGVRNEARGLSYPKIEAMALLAGPVPQAIGDIHSVSTSSEVGPYSGSSYGVLIRTAVNFLIPFYTFGKLENYEKAGEHGLKAAESGVAMKRDEVTRDIVKAYWAFMTLLDILETLEQGEKLLEEVTQKIETLLEQENPSVTETDRLKLNYFKSQIKIRKLDAVNALEQVRAAIKVLSGFSREDTVDLKRLPCISNLPELKSLNDFIDSAMRKRPELKLALHSKMARLELFNASQKLMFPDFYFGAEFKHSWSNATTDQTNPFVKDDWNYIEGGLGIGFRLNLDIMVSLAKRKQAMGEFHKASALYEFAHRNIPLDVKNKYSSAEEARQKFALREDAEKAVRSWIAAEMMNFELGIADTRSLIEALVASFEAPLTKYGAALELHHAYADLLHSTGEIERFVDEVE